MVKNLAITSENEISHSNKNDEVEEKLFLCITDRGDHNRLKWVDLRNNEIECLPEEIGLLENLETLLLSDNLIRELPVSLKNLPKLYCLHVFNNPLKFPPENVIKRGTRYILEYLREFQDGSVDSISFVNKISEPYKTKEYLRQSKIYLDKRKLSNTNNSSSKWKVYKKQSQRESLLNKNSILFIGSSDREKAETLEDKALIKVMENVRVQRSIQKIKDKLMKEKWLEKAIDDRYYFNLVYSQKNTEEIKNESKMRILLSPYDVSLNSIKVLSASENYLQKLLNVKKNKPNNLSKSVIGTINELDNKRLQDLLENIKNLHEEIGSNSYDGNGSDRDLLKAMEQLNRAIDIFKNTQELQNDLRYFDGTCRHMIQFK